MTELNKSYLGIIEDINDPLKIGRVKIRIPFLHGDIPTSDLVWSYPKRSLIFGQGGKCGAISVPKLNSTVRVKFINGNQYSSEYEAIQELADDIKAELKSEYEGTHVLLYDGDEKLKIYYTKNKGITIDLQNSFVNIGNDKIITIQHADTDSMIELAGGIITINANSQINSTAVTSINNKSKEVWCEGEITKIGKNPTYAAVAGEPLFLLLKILASAIDAKMYPTPGVNAAIVEATKQFALSKTVTVSL